MAGASSARAPSTCSQPSLAAHPTRRCLTSSSHLTTPSLTTSSTRKPRRSPRYISRHLAPSPAISAASPLHLHPTLPRPRLRKPRQSAPITRPSPRCISHHLGVSRAISLYLAPSWRISRHLGASRAVSLYLASSRRTSRQVRLAQAYASRAAIVVGAPPTASAISSANSARNRRPLVVGYVSTDFGEHPTSHLMRSLWRIQGVIRDTYSPRILPEDIRRERASSRGRRARARALDLFRALTARRLRSPRLHLAHVRGVRRPEPPLFCVGRRRDTISGRADPGRSERPLRQAAV